MTPPEPATLGFSLEAPSILNFKKPGGGGCRSPSPLFYALQPCLFPRGKVDVDQKVMIPTCSHFSLTYRPKVLLSHHTIKFGVQNES